MEWLPKFVDVLDSLVFESRMRWAGCGGQSLRALLTLASVLFLAGTSPVFRQLVLATVVSFMFAELVDRAARGQRGRDYFGRGPVYFGRGPVYFG